MGSHPWQPRDARRRFIFRRIVPVFLAAIVSRLLVAGLYVVPSASMEETLSKGDHILGLRTCLVDYRPTVGDVVTFKSPEELGVTLVKRIVATEGQVVDLRDGSLLVDGTQMVEPFATGATLAPDEGEGLAFPHVVRKGCVFVMGDNRERSRDSRWFGDVETGSISSHVVLLYWPPWHASPISDVSDMN